ncbi:MAG TPA: efflux transporter outer membrane subunit [Steroidobacteraceae bacterium]|nr:efflux transporter outer membrane subunit [Steroidobacteraceae bacterium]
MSKTKAALAVLCSLIAACAVGPNYHPPKRNTPDAWAGLTQSSQPSVVTSQSADLARWWEQFHDPALMALVEEALKANPSLAIAEANLRQARALRDVAAGGLWPSLSASASYQRQAGPLYYTNGTPRNLYQADFDAAWELDIFGGVRRQVESAAANVQVAVENIRDVQVSIAAEVALDYVQLRGNQQEVVTAQNNLEVERHTAEITRKLYKVGFDSGLDMAEAQSIVATTEAQIPVNETAARQSIYALSVLLGRPPAYLLERLAPIGDLPSIPAQIPAGMPSDLLRRRPDIRQAEAALHGATAQIGVAVAQLFPQFSLSGGSTWQSTGLHRWFESSNRSVFAGPAVSWPIFQGGAIVANIHAQEALRDQAFISYQQSVLTALQDVENALIAFTEEQAHQKSLSDAVAADHKAVDLSLTLFQQGQTDFLNVLTAQRTLYTDDSALTQSKENVAADLIALYKALGGGWEAPRQ